MAKKLTNEELEQRVQELEEEVIKHKHADEELLILQDIFDKIQVGLYIYRLEDINDDKTLKMIRANQTAAEFTGVEIKDVVGKTLDENFPSLREKGNPQIYAEVVRSGEMKILKDIDYGDDRVIQNVFSVKAFPVLNDCVGVSFENIAARKKAEEALSKSEAEYRSTVNHLLVGVVAHATDTRILVSNPAATNILGRTAEQMLGKGTFDPEWSLVHEDSTKMKIEDYPVNKVISTKMPLYDYVLGINRPDRDYVTWVNVNAVPIFSNDGELEKVIVNFADITERKGAEAELKSYQDHLEQLVGERTNGLRSANKKLAQEIEERKQAEEALLQEKEKLQDALAKIKTLSGMLPICASCKKIRDDKGYWNQIEGYIERHSGALFSHGMCPECMDKIYGDEDWYKKEDYDK
jgi:PAS domain S-box-containing protein